MEVSIRVCVRLLRGLQGEEGLDEARGRLARCWIQVVLSCVSSKFALMRSSPCLISLTSRDGFLCKQQTKWDRERTSRNSAFRRCFHKRLLSSFTQSPGTVTYHR